MLPILIRISLGDLSHQSWVRDTNRVLHIASDEPRLKVNLRGETSAVGDFLEAIRHIRQNCVSTNFRLQVLDSSRPFYSDNEIPKFDVYISTNTRVFIVGIEELFLLAKTDFYLRC